MEFHNCVSKTKLRAVIFVYVDFVHDYVRPILTYSAMCIQSASSVFKLIFKSWTFSFATCELRIKSVWVLEYFEPFPIRWVKSRLISTYFLRVKTIFEQNSFFLQNWRHGMKEPNNFDEIVSSPTTVCLKMDLNSKILNLDYVTAVN